MQYEITRDGATTVLRLRQHLAFQDRREFVELIPQLTAPGTERIVVDMKELRFLDSAGLGMLIALKDASEKANAQMSLRDPVAGVKTLLKLSQFESVLPIEHTEP